MDHKKQLPFASYFRHCRKDWYKKVFTEMDFRWGYSNVWMKEGDQWKAVFTIPEGLFKPTVILFGLTNSLAMF